MLDGEAEAPIASGAPFGFLPRIADAVRAQGTRMILSEVRTQPLRAIVRAHKLEILGGRNNLAPTLDVAIERAGNA